MKQKNNQKVQELVISQEEKQNHPFVRAIAKKIRNINKKLLDIETLEKRNDLKPEQQEKINSKQATIDERKKFEDFIRFYRTTIAEAANDKEAKQVEPVLSKLGNSLVLAHHLVSGAQVNGLNFNVTEKTIISNLASVGRQQASLQQLGAQLGGYFSQYLNNEKLVTKVETAFANENIGGTRVNLYQKTQIKTQPQPQAVIKQTPKKEQVRQITIQEVKVQEQPIQTTEQPKIEQLKDSTVVVSQQQPKKEITNVVQTTSQPQVSGQVTNQANKRGPQRDRPYKPYQGNKRPYKPRYNEKKEAGDEDQSDEEQIERSRFNNKEMRELENDGFIVIQKKQKPKDPKESQGFYKKQHGYKQKKLYHNN